MSENLVKGVLLQDDGAGGSRVGLFDYDNLANRPNFGGSQNGNDITQWAGSVNKLIPFEINVKDGGKNDSSTDTQEIRDITLLHNNTEVTFEDIRDMVVNGVTIVCIYDNRLLPFVYNTTIADDGKFYFQAGGGSTIYQVVVSKSFQQLNKVRMALGGTLDKVINELYGVEDGKIPANGASRLDNLLYCYFDPSSKKLYKDKDYTQQMTRAELQTFVTNNFKEYQRQVYCIWPSYKNGNQGRYLRLVQCGGSSGTAKFSGFYYNDKYNTWDFKTVLLNADSSATGKEWALDLASLEQQSTDWHYGSILTAFADINADTIGKNADDQDGVVVSYNNFGRLQVLLTKDITIDNELKIDKSCDLILNGYTLEKTDASKNIKVLGKEVKIFGGDSYTDTFKENEKRGKIISSGQTGVLVGSENFLIQNVHIETTNNGSGSTYGIADNTKEIGTFPTKEIQIKNCYIITKSSVKSSVNQIGSCGSYFKSADKSKILIEDCTFEVEGASAFAYGIASAGKNFHSIKNTKISTTLYDGEYLDNDIPSTSGISLNLGESVYCEGLIITCSGQKANCYTTPFILPSGVSQIKDVKATIEGYHEFYFTIYKGGRCFADNLVFKPSKPSEVTNILQGNMEMNLSNCAFENFNFAPSSGEIAINFGTGCSFETKPETSETIHFTEELYREVNANQICTGNDFAALKNYVSGSILSQLSAIVDGGM